MRKILSFVSPPPFFFQVGKGTAEEKIVKGLLSDSCICSTHGLCFLEIFVFKTKDGKYYCSLNKYMAYCLVMSQYVSREIKLVMKKDFK